MIEWGAAAEVQHERGGEWHHRVDPAWDRDHAVWLAQHWFPTNFKRRARNVRVVCRQVGEWVEPDDRPLDGQMRLVPTTGELDALDAAGLIPEIETVQPQGGVL